MRRAMLPLLFTIPLLFAQTTATQPTSRPAATAPATAPSPNVTFCGLADHADRVVLIIDNTGSMYDTWLLLRQETSRAVRGLHPGQSFAVLLTGSANSEAAMVTVTDRNKPKAIADIEQLELAKQAQDDMLSEALGAFTKAIALKPDVIYFASVGHVDDHLCKEVSKLNPNAKVRINTIAFVHGIEKDEQEQLRDLAKANGGTFRFVAEKELGK